MGIRIRIQDPGLNKRMKFILEIVFFGLNDYRYIELTFGQILGFFYTSQGYFYRKRNN